MEIYIFMLFFWFVGYLYSVGREKVVHEIGRRKYPTKSYFRRFIDWPVVAGGFKEIDTHAKLCLIESIANSQGSIAENSKYHAAMTAKISEMIAESIRR